MGWGGGKYKYSDREKCFTEQRVCIKNFLLLLLLFIVFCILFVLNMCFKFRKFLKQNFWNVPFNKSGFSEKALEGSNWFNFRIHLSLFEKSGFFLAILIFHVKTINLRLRSYFLRLMLFFVCLLRKFFL